MIKVEKLKKYKLGKSTWVSQEEAIEIINGTGTMFAAVLGVDDPVARVLMAILVLCRHADTQEIDGLKMINLDQIYTSIVLMRNSYSVVAEESDPLIRIIDLGLYLLGLNDNFKLKIDEEEKE